MIPNLRSVYHASEEQAKLAMFGLFGLLLFGFLGTVFFSSALVVAVVIVIVGIAMTFLRPHWTVFALAIYLPFEPFLLKWIPDDVYVFARYGSELVVYLLCSVVMWRMVTGSIRFRRSPIDLAFVVVVLLALASVIVNTVTPWIAILGLRQIFRFILLFFVAAYLAPSKKFVRTLLITLMMIVVVQSVLGYAQRVIGTPLDTFLLPSAQRTLGDLQLTSGTTQFWDPGQRVFGTVGRYDQLGTFMAFFLIILVAFLYEGVLKKEEEIPAWAILLFSLPVLGLTYSRSAWFGFVLAFLFIALYIKRDKRVMAVSVIVPMLLLGYLSFTGLVVGRLIDTADQSFVERFFEAFSIERFKGEYYGLGRVYWIAQTVSVVVPAAPLFGHGPGMYGGGAVAALGNTEVYDALGLPFGVYGTEGYIDNNWMSMWGELGTLGLGAYMVMYLTLFGACIHVYRESTDSETRALALGMSAAMIAVALNAFLATYLEARTLAVYLWMFGGIVVAEGKKEGVL
jgi:hypothetical protein